MKDLEQALQAGRELPAPPELTSELKGAVDSAAGAAPVAAAASGSSLTAWVAGALTAAVIATAVTLFLWDSGQDPLESNDPVHLANQEGGEVDGVSGIDDGTGAIDTDLTSDSTTGLATGSVTIVDKNTPTLHGVIMEADGTPIPHSHVLVKLTDSRSGRLLTTLKVRSDANGRYACTQEQLFRKALAALDTEEEKTAERLRVLLEKTGKSEAEGQYYITAGTATDQLGSFSFHAGDEAYYSAPDLRPRLEEALELAKGEVVERTVNFTYEQANVHAIDGFEAVVAPPPTAVDVTLQNVPVLSISAREQVKALAEQRAALDALQEAQAAEAAAKLAEEEAAMAAREAQVAEKRMQLDKQLASLEQLRRTEEEVSRRIQVVTEERAAQQAIRWAELSSVRLAEDSNRAAQQIWWHGKSGFTVRLTAVMDGFRGSSAKHHVTGAETVEQDFELEPGHTLRGFVRDGRRPIAGAVVEVIASATDHNLPEEARQVTTGRDGSFFFASLASEMNVVQVTATGWQDAQKVQIFRP